MILKYFSSHEIQWNQSSLRLVKNKIFNKECLNISWVTICIGVFLLASHLSAGEIDSSLSKSPNGMIVRDNLIQAGAELLGQHLTDKESMSGSCQILDDPSSNLPRPCSMVRFLLTPMSQGQDRTFQTTPSGTFTMGDLKSDRYHLRVVTPGYKLKGPEPVIVQRGRNILIVLIK